MIRFVVFFVDRQVSSTIVIEMCQCNVLTVKWTESRPNVLANDRVRFRCVYRFVSILCNNAQHKVWMHGELHSPGWEKRRANNILWNRQMGLICVSARALTPIYARARWSLVSCSPIKTIPTFQAKQRILGSSPD